MATRAPRRGCWSWVNAPGEGAIADLLSGLCAHFEGHPQTVHLRRFRSEFGRLYDVAWVELQQPITIFQIDVLKFGRMARHLDPINVYLEYFRKGETPPGAY